MKMKLVQQSLPTATDKEATISSSSNSSCKGTGSFVSLQLVPPSAILPMRHALNSPMDRLIDLPALARSHREKARRPSPWIQHPTFWSGSWGPRAHYLDDDNDDDNNNNNNNNRATAVRPTCRVPWVAPSCRPRRIRPQS